jgi:hypothetical protein
MLAPHSESDPTQRSELEGTAFEVELPMLEGVAPVDLVPLHGDEALVPSRKLLGVRRPFPMREVPLAPCFGELGIEALDRLVMGTGIGNELHRNRKGEPALSHDT